MSVSDRKTASCLLTGVLPRSGFPVWIFFWLLLLGSTQSATADGLLFDSETGERKKIGLVLSGGGARGGAHVGVLNVLEELRVPVDYVVGTSLGSVVGALYSIGRTPAELQFILSTLEWSRGFTDDLPREKLPLRRKDEEDEFQINFEIGVQNKSLTLPAGVLQGHGLHLLLKTLVGEAVLEKDFDNFPIPYRAVTTDIEKSETVVIDSGDVAKAIQASMSIPAIFAAVPLQDRLLVDGGVSNNLAVDVVRDMGADIVIAVDIGTQLSKQNQLNSVLRIVDQLTNILTRKNVEQQIATLGEADILIQPELEDFSATDFAVAGIISERGEIATREIAPALNLLALSEEGYREYKNQLAARALDPFPKKLKSVELRQNTGLDGDLLKERMNLKEGDEFSTEDLHGAIDSLYATAVFDVIDYSVERDEQDYDAANVVINAKRKSWGTDNIRFGFVLEDNLEGENNFNVNAAYHKRAVNGRGGTGRALGQFGELPRVLIELFQPFEKRNNFFSLYQFEHEQFTRGTFDGSTQIETFRIRSTSLRGFLGWQNRNNLDVRVGLSTGLGGIRRVIGGGESSKVDDFREGTFEFRARYDSLDSITFPSDGLQLSFEYERSVGLLNSDADYDAVSIEALMAKRTGKVRWVLGGEASSSLSGVLPQQRAFGRGSILSSVGLRTETEVGEQAARASMIAYRSLTTERVEALENPIFLGFSFEYGGVFQEGEDFDFGEGLLSGSIFLGADTPIGPFYFNVGATETKGFTALLALGLTF